MMIKRIIAFTLILSVILSLTPFVFAEDAEFFVVSTTPHNGAYNVSPINLKVQVEFSRDVDASTLTSDNITVSGEALGCIVATDTNKASIYLERSAVALKETYTVTFKEGVKALDGTPLSEESISFTVTENAPKYRQISNSDMSDIYYNGAFDGDYLGGDFLGGYIYLDGNPSLKYVPAWDGASARQRVYLEAGKSYTARARVKSDTSQEIWFGLSYVVPDSEEWYHTGTHTEVSKDKWTDITYTWDIPGNAVVDKNVLYVASGKAGSTVYVDDLEFFSFDNDADEPIFAEGDSFTRVVEGSDSLAKMKALGVVSHALGEDIVITRLELAASMLRFLGISTEIVKVESVSDVSDDSASAMYIADKLGIVNGGEKDELYAPVSFDDVAAALVVAMGYDAAAEAADYLNKAHELGIFDGVKQDGEITAGELALILDNALDVKVVAPKKYSASGAVSYSKRGTALEECLRLKKDTGRIEATHKTRIDGESSLKENIVIIDGTEYICSADLNPYLGAKAEFIYRENTRGKMLLYVDGIMQMNKSQTFSTFDDYLDYSGGVYTYIGEDNREKHYRLSADPNVIYNGKYVNNPGESLMVPHYGTVTLWGEGGEYNTVIINDIKTVVADAIDADNMTIYASGLNKPLNLMRCESVEIFDKFGFERDYSYIKPGDVLSVSQSIDSSLVKIYISGDVLTGTVTGVSSQNDNITVTVDGKRDVTAISGKVDPDSIYVGAGGKFLLDYRGRLASFTSLSDNRKMGYLVDAVIEGALTKEVKFKIFDESGEMLFLTGGERIKIDGKTKKDANEIIGALMKSHHEVISQLVVYDIDSQGKLTYIDTAYNKLPDCTDYRLVMPGPGESPDGFKVTHSSILPPNDTPDSLVYYMSSRSFENKVYLSSSAKIFVVPLDSKNDDDDKYHILPSYWSLGYGYSNIIEAYSLNPDSFETQYLVIYIKEKNWQINAKAGDSFGIVKDLRMVEKDDELLWKISFADGEICYTDKEEWLGGAGIGDYVCYRTDKNNKFIRAGLVFFDAPTQTVYVGNPYGSISDSDRMVFANVYERRGTVVKVVLPKINIADEAQVSTEALIIDLSKADIYRYNKELDKVEKATSEDIMDYVSTGEDYSGLLMVTYEGYARQVLITE